jgi:hypothetical protein
MNFGKKRYIVILVLILASLFLLIINGSSNTPLSNQGTFDEVALTDDPSNSWQFPDLNIQLPEINIPFIEGVFGFGDIGLTIIFIIFFVMLILLIGSIVISHVRKVRKRELIDKKDLTSKPDQKEMKIRRKKLGKRIEEIIFFLKSCLDGEYSSGITIGFERLDSALKEYSKISRPGWLTPREFSHLEIPYFNHTAMINAVEKFYRITYGEKTALKKDLEEFIHNLERAIEDQQVLDWYSDVPISVEEVKD